VLTVIAICLCIIVGKDIPLVSKAEALGKQAVDVNMAAIGGYSTGRGYIKVWHDD
jgi:hypothetical protein